MPKLTPIDWRILSKIFEADGWQHKRTKGTHRSYTKAGFSRAIVIPMYPQVGIDIILSNMRTAKMNRERYFQLLAEVS